MKTKNYETIQVEGGYVLRIPQTYQVSRSDGDCAAWVTVMDLIPGDYPLELKESYWGGPRYYATVPGIVRFKDSASRFAGVAYSNPEQSKRDRDAVGKKDSYTFSFERKYLEESHVSGD